jgi:hypothetical protein
MACTLGRTRVVEDGATGLSSPNGVDIIPRSAVRVGRDEPGLVNTLPASRGRVVTGLVDVEEAGEMAREFAHGLEVEAVRRA